MTPTDAPDAEPDPARQTVDLDGLTDVLGAGRREAAARRRPGHHDLVAADRAHAGAGTPRGTRAHAAARRQSASASRSSANDAPAAAGVAPTRYAESERTAARSASSAVRSRRRTRLRVTALPTRRPTAYAT